MNEAGGFLRLPHLDPGQVRLGGPHLPGRPEALDFLYYEAAPPGVELAAGLSGALPLVIRDRPPDMVRALRRLIAEEHAARGEPSRPDDPIERVARGSWYHGVSEVSQAHNALRLPEDIFEKGLPISYHYGTPGEPAGVSLTANPIVSGLFGRGKAFRVFPLYEGPPKKAIIDLTSKAGLKEFERAYRKAFRETFTPDLAFELGLDLVYMMRNEPGMDPYRAFINAMRNAFSRTNKAAELNKRITDELLSKGKRFVVYHPKRYSEYEMLALDPKYVVPLDYRDVRDYALLNMSGFHPRSRLIRFAYSIEPGYLPSGKRPENLPTSELVRIYKEYVRREPSKRMPMVFTPMASKGFSVLEERGRPIWLRDAFKNWGPLRVEPIQAEVLRSSLPDEALNFYGRYLPVPEQLP
ncbi:MAG: hypothetical protein N3E40_01525 [Dehalococcoidia bacterium]|nr:hypothetical protein [Dehalococcoidia bacterium]